MKKKAKPRCQRCDKEIDSGTWYIQKFCCKECRVSFNNDKRKKPRKCLNCGKDTNKKYCSLSCGVKYRNKQRGNK